MLPTGGDHDIYLMPSSPTMTDYEDAMELEDQHQHQHEVVLVMEEPSTTTTTTTPPTPQPRAARSPFFPRLPTPSAASVVVVDVTKEPVQKDHHRDEEEEATQQPEEVSSSSSFGDHSHVLEWSIDKVEVGRAKKRKTLIRDIVGRTESGEFTAIMGPSGAGKTTLIECLSLRNRDFEGALHLDGVCPGGEYFTSASLVHQKELLFGFMTVREHLYFHAVTKMGKLFSKRHMENRIETVMSDMRLLKCADTMIGGTDPIFFAKGLSGGERKRLSIATELLLCPSLIFLDEPTSGLDSVIAETVILSLRDLTNRGVLVMASIHSPNSEMVSLFTHMLLLTAEGRVAYHGPMQGALTYFEAMGHVLPKAYSPTDFFLRLVSKNALRPADEEAAKLGAMAAAWRASPLNHATILPAGTGHRHFSGVRNLRVSDWDLFKLNIWRGLLQNRRDVLTFGLWGAALAIIGFIFGVLYFQQAGSGNWRNIVGMLFSVVVAIMFTSAVGNMVRFPLEWTVVVREYMSGANAMGPYIAAKWVYDLPYLYGPFLLSVLLYWMTGMPADAGTFMKFSSVIMLTGFCSTSVGVYIASFSPNPLVGLSLIPAVITPMVMFSGILYQRSTMPGYLKWMENLSIVNYSFSTLLSIQIPYLPEEGQKLVLAFTEVDPTRIQHNVTMLLIMIATSAFLTYVNLRLRVAFASTNV